MTRFVAAVLAGALGALVPDSAVAQAKRYPLESLDHLRLHNVIAEPATFEGKRGLRVTATPEAARQEGEPPMLAWIEGLDFSNGTIEAERWTKIRIEVRGERARLYVHDQQQPALIVNDVKSGANRKGAVALWIGTGTVAHFRNLIVTPESDSARTK